MKFTDYPTPVPLSDYNALIERTVELLAGFPGILSIYQIGGITEPGISDIDFFAVFEDDADCPLDPRSGLDSADRYMIMHSLYGACRSHWNAVQRYTFFHNYRLLWGESLPIPDSGLQAVEVTALKRQIALEYLVKMYANVTVETAYDICRVRGLLLHVKGILYDLDFLGIDSGPLYELVSTVIEWRKSWFERPVPAHSLHDWFRSFSRQLAATLEHELQKGPLYLPEASRYRLSRNMLLVPSGDFGHIHRGVRLPSFLGGLGRKYFNVQHRFNTFEFRVPAISTDHDSVITERFRFLTSMRDYNRQHIGHFSPAASSLTIV